MIETSLPNSEIHILLLVASLN